MCVGGYIAAVSGTAASKGRREGEASRVVMVATTMKYGGSELVVVQIAVFDSLPCGQGRPWEWESIYSIAWLLHIH